MSDLSKIQAQAALGGGRSITQAELDADIAAAKREQSGWACGVEKPNGAYTDRQLAVVRSHHDGGGCTAADESCRLLATIDADRKTIAYLEGVIARLETPDEAVVEAAKKAWNAAPLDIDIGEGFKRRSTLDDNLPIAIVAAVKAARASASSWS